MSVAARSDWFDSRAGMIGEGGGISQGTTDNIRRWVVGAARGRLIGLSLCEMVRVGRRRTLLKVKGAWVAMD